MVHPYIPAVSPISMEQILYPFPSRGSKLKPIQRANAVSYPSTGFIKFLESWYMILCTKRRQIGNICGHAIYGIDETQLLTIAHPSVQSDLANSRVEVRSAPASAQSSASVGGGWLRCMAMATSVCGLCCMGRLEIGDRRRGLNM